MSYTPTPETDAAQHEGLLRTNPIPLQVVTAEFARKLERERDEARAKLDDWENAEKHVESDHSDEVHCSCVPVLRKLLNDSKKERDEAREAIRALAEHGESEIQRISKEREEAKYFLEELAEADSQLKVRMAELCDVLCKTEKERDEARAIAGELADVASKYLSFLLAVTPSKTNETHEKETMKVIDALKRWKEL
jgi:hypothetical protein